MNTNMDLLSKTLIFAAGAIVGSAVAWYLTKKKYDSPIDWVVDEEEPTEVNHEVGVGSELKENKTPDMVRYNKYVKLYSNEEKIEKEETEAVDRPYRISVDEYAEMDDYSVVSLYYYEDHVLTDELGNVIDDADDAVGEDNLREFDELETDSIYIRNDGRMTDYEILRDMGCYFPVTKED